VILLLALIVLGPQRLPEAARKLGHVIGEVRRMASGFQSEMRSALDEADLSTRPPAKSAVNPQRRVLPPDRGAAPSPAAGPEPEAAQPEEPEARPADSEPPATVPPDAVT
jgi:sec-independent protein translocase protein TatB